MCTPRFSAAILLVLTLSATVVGQSPVPPKTLQPTPGYLLTIDDKPTAELVVVDPQDAPYKPVDATTIFVESAAIKGGVIRICQVVKGEPHRWYSWVIGPPVPPAPIVLPTARLTAEPPNVKPGESTTLTWATTGADKVTLDSGDGPKDVDLNGSAVTLPRLPISLFTIAATNPEGQTFYSQAIVTVSDLPPPIPNPTPITEKGFRVLIVEETEDRINLPASQREILLSLADGGVRKFLESKCVKDSKGNPEFRILDKDNDLSRDSKVWQDAWKIPHTPLPYLIATNGVTGFAGPLPKTSDETIAILQRIAGP